MFESLKKKLSRTSDKIEEEIVEEAKKEENIKEESGKKRSFFSFGRKNKDEDKDDKSESEKSEEKEEFKSSFWSMGGSEKKEDDEKDEPGEKGESKSDFWSGDKSKDESDDSKDDGEKDESEEKGESKSGFWSGDKSKDESDDSKDDGEKDESGEKGESKSGFWSRSKSEDDSDDSEDNEEKEESKSRFWSRSKSKEETDEDNDESKDDGGKSHFWSRGKSEEDSDDDSEDNEKTDDTDEKEESKSGFWSRGKSKEESEEDTDDSDDGEGKSHFWSRNKSKDDSDDEGSGGLFSFVREKTISEKHVEDTLWELEMGLLEGDVAMEVASSVVDSVKNDLVGRKIKRSGDITEYTYNALRNAVGEIIDIPGKSMTEMIEEKKAAGEPLVVMFVGINGTGKTTTIGKLANYYLKKGYTPVIAASDTFRAGAIEQVTYHADNVGVKIIKHQKGSDPAAVAYDAVEHARAQGKELVLIDTAGRMQTNTNLMDEMKKIKRVSKPDLVVFVGDALTGNDATQQAVKFNEAIDVDGVILTKADADSKGGASLSIGYVIKKPIMFLGMGQGYDDIKEYDAEWMLDQLFSEDEEASIEE